MSNSLTTETILIEFAKTVKVAAFYPEGHPNLEMAIERTFNLLKAAVKERGEVKWVVERAGFQEANLPIGRSHKPLEGFAKDLFLKKIREITFTQDATLKEWKDLLNILKMDVDSLKRAGGLEKLLVTKEIKGIQLNEMRYEDIRKSIIALEEDKKKHEMEIGQEGSGEKKEEKPSNEAETEEKEEEIKPEEDFINNIEKQLDDVKGKEETIQDLLLKLEEEEDTKKYQTIANKIMEKARPIIEDKNWEELSPALIAFTAHSHPNSNRSPEQKTLALDKLKEMLNTDILGYLTTRICNYRENRRNEIQQMLLLLGEEAMKHLLNTLINTDESYSRRQIFNTLTMFGEKLRLEAEKRLDDNRWFVVRQMVVLLGEIGNVQSFDALKTSFSHKDIRIKKELLKVLGKISSNESRAFLLERLNEANPVLKLQAIVSLGMLKEQTAIEPLGGIALMRDFFNENTEIRKETVRALGLIGSDKAITILRDILKKRVLLGRKQNDEIRTLAAISLGRIGGKTALQILEETSKSATGIVHLACKKAMEGIK